MAPLSTRDISSLTLYYVHNKLKKRKFAKYFPGTPKDVFHNKLLFCFGGCIGFITRVYLL